MDATVPAATHATVAVRAADPLAYEVAVYDHGGSALSAEVYTDHQDLITCIAEEGDHRADPDILEVIERRADGTVIRHDRDTVDAWCAERDHNIALDRAHQRTLGVRRATV